ncbi:MAG: GatB/YqeY domain-containing protein [Candidatus Omnitrophica bacterium]|nr:GatB/YqeY domain-containing protein [Candidatus Omnitrophota bacterium]
MLQEKITNDYKEAMKKKDAVKVSTLSFLRAAIQNLAIEKKEEKLDDKDIIPVIKKQVKQRQDSIEQFKKGNRNDLVEKETKELEILKTYLPEELPIDEIKKIIEEAVASTGASSPKDMGKVIKEVMAKVAGRADGKLVSGLVKEKLSKPTDGQK